MKLLPEDPKMRRWVIQALILASHVVPTVVIGFGFVIPGSCIAGINEHTLGFISSIVGYIVTFSFGVYVARRMALDEARREAAHTC